MEGPVSFTPIRASSGGTASSSMPGSTNVPNTGANSSGSTPLCCLTDDGVRCAEVAGNASYSKRIQKTVQQKKLRLTIDSSARHTYICDRHKSIIQSVRTLVKRKRKDSCDEENGANSNDGYTSAFDHLTSDAPQVDLSVLQVNTLRRYKRHFRIQTRPGMNKSQLAEALMKHFRTHPVIEKEAITYFVYMAKANKNKLDQMKGFGGNSSYLVNSGSATQSGSLSDHGN